ncbi:MAG: cytochrome c oxidase assembly factor Coa1 family protein [bacterium]|nr:cytochrome c oxidase assembly factor 1 family protein [bacterium]MBU1917596.1 cytochrome c oxidase assembly factor 1 family protein [bacterium]
MLDEITKQLNDMKEKKRLTTTIAQKPDADPTTKLAAKPPVILTQEKIKEGTRAGCLLPIGCAAGLLLIVGLAVAIIFFVFHFIKSNDVYEYALEKARKSPGVVQAIGEPIKAAWYVSGSLSSSENSGQANFTIPISGPKGSADINVMATKISGQWKFDSLFVAIDDKDLRINLLQHQIQKIHGPKRKRK